MTLRPVDLPDLLAQFRARRAALPGPEVAGVQARAEHIAAHVRAQIHPSMWRAAGEAMFLTASMTASTPTLGAASGLQALVGLTLIDAATVDALAAPDVGA